MQSTRGGVAFLIPVLIGLTIAAGSAIINNWDSFKAGLMGYPDPVAKKTAE